MRIWLILQVRMLPAGAVKASSVEVAGQSGVLAGGAGWVRSCRRERARRARRRVVGRGRSGLAALLAFGAFLVAVGAGCRALPDGGERGHPKDVAQLSVVSAGPAVVARYGTGVAADRRQAGVGGKFRSGRVFGHAGGVDEEFGGEQGAHAGQAAHDRCKWVLIEVFGDEVIDAINAVLDGEDLGGHLPEGDRRRAVPSKHLQQSPMDSRHRAGGERRLGR